jgi:predicted ATPase
MKTVWLAAPGSPSARATLSPDNWDDYTYKTTILVKLRIDAENELTLGAAKFIYRNQPEHTKSWDAIPDSFVSLDENWASLGQDPDYYERLATLNPTLQKRYFNAVRDAAWDPAIEAAFADDDAWSTSILRFSQASEALRRGRELFHSPTNIQPKTEPSTLHFQLPSTDRPGAIDIKFNFGSPAGEPSPIAAIIGYNGTGKTTALARIARIAHVDSTQQSEPSFIQANGKLVSLEPNISSVLMISFSAFDNFTLPSEMTPRVKDARKDGADDYFGYSYCGLRVRSDSESEYLLKGSKQMEQELEKNYLRSIHPSRSGYLDTALDELAMEPSAEQLGRPSNVKDLSALYRRLSSGHKIVLSSVLHLCGRLHKRTLVLIDEPESHLHPSLLSAFLRTLRRLLVESESRAIIATHSPILLQELPSRAVLIMSRSFGMTTASAPEVETFAESLERITAQVFQVDASRSDYHETLRELADRYSFDEIEQMYPLGLPARAWSYIRARKTGERR